MADEFHVVHVPEKSRYEMRQGELLIGFADARPEGDSVVFPHVEIAPAFERQGLGTRLVREALTDVIGKGLKIVAHCPFVVFFLRHNPEFAA
jgi:predicted GNAT family acetyltransferase